MVDFYDPQGYTIKRDALRAPQTAKIASLHQEFADHPTRGLTPQRLSSIMDAAERGDLSAQSDLFEDMEEKDGHIMAELGKRKRALLGLGWSIEPPVNATEQEQIIAETVQELMLTIPDFEDTLLGMGDGIGHGFACLELNWVRDHYWLPQAIEHHPARWFSIAQDNQNKLMLRDGSAAGAELWPAGWIVHKHKAKSGILSRSGLHRALAWPYLFKNYSVRDLAEFLEIYGLPVRLGKYPSNASEEEKMTLLNAVVNMGHAAAGIIPDGMLVDFKEAAKGGSDPYQSMMSWCENTQSKVILGGTLTSQADGASSTNALGNVHNEVRRELTVSDAIQFASTLTRDLVHIICRLNGWASNPRRLPRFTFDVLEAEDLALYADAIPKLVAVGLPISTNYLYEKLRIPQPQKGEPVLRHAAMPQNDTTALKGKTSALEIDDADIIADNMMSVAAGGMAGLINPVRELVSKANSLEEIREQLDEIELDESALGTALQKGRTIANMAGRADVEDEDE